MPLRIISNKLSLFPKSNGDFLGLYTYFIFSEILFIWLFCYVLPVFLPLDLPPLLRLLFRILSFCLYFKFLCLSLPGASQYSSTFFLGDVMLLGGFCMTYTFKLSQIYLLSLSLLYQNACLLSPLTVLKTNETLKGTTLSPQFATSLVSRLKITCMFLDSPFSLTSHIKLIAKSYGFHLQLIT